MRVYIREENIEKLSMRSDSTDYNTMERHVGQASTRHCTSGHVDQSDDCCMCCCLICIGLGYLLCCKKTARACRIQILVFWVTTIAVTSGFLVAYGTFGTYSFQDISTDMRIVDKKISNIFCDGVEISAANEIDAYLLPQKPTIEVGRMQIYNVSDVMYLETGEYKYRIFRLLSGSTISLSSCAYSFSEMFLIKGKTNFNKWVSDRSCIECYLGRMEIFSFSCSNNYVNYSFNVEESDDYYVVFISYAKGTWLTAIFSLNKTLYDLRNASQFCTATVSCDFELSLRKNEYVIVQTLATKTLELTDISTSCERRYWVFFMMFGVLPLTIGMIISISIYALCKDPENVDNLYSYTHGVTSRTPLIRSEYRRQLSTTATKPPKYEDVVRNEPQQLPDYNEALLYIRQV